MKIIAHLLLAASLIVGFIGALTAYVPRLDEQAVAGLHLNAPAGDKNKGQGTPEPVAAPRTELTSDVIAQLKEGGVERVRIREFAFSRWTGWWLYLIGAMGLLATGLMLRWQRKIEPALTAPIATGVPSDPAQILADMRGRIENLLRVLPAEPLQSTTTMDYAPPHLGTHHHGRPPLAESIIREVGEIQLLLMPAFIDARPRLVAAFGMGGYARLMDVYAAAERAMNRAWSAAADNDEIEAINSLQRALVLLDETARRLPGSAF